MEWFDEHEPDVGPALQLDPGHLRVARVQPSHRAPGAATVVGAFLTGWPSIIAVILNYVKQSEVRGTWLESHFRWQIRTFWYGLLWVGLCVLFIIGTFGIGILIAWLPLLIVGVWFVYRTVRGWIALREGRGMYA